MRSTLKLQCLEDRTVPSFTASVTGNTATFVGNGASDALRFSIDAGLLKHNRFTAGDTGFASDLDFVSGDGAVVTTLPAAAPTSVNVQAGAGDDTIAFASGLNFLNAIVDGGIGSDTLDFSAVATPTFTSTGGEVLLLTQLAPAPGSTAGGISGNMFDPVTGVFTMGIEVTGVPLSSITGSNMRLGPVGSGGPVLFDLGDSSFWAESPGIVSRTVVNVTFPAANIADVLAGNVYLNIETSAFPGGEARGQMLPAAMPHSATGLAVGGLTGVENVRGGSSTNGMLGDSGPNSFTGGNAFDMLLGRGGDDILHGGGAFDVVVGGPGVDRVFGDDGDDRIVWNNGDGNDTVEGGSGFDNVVANGSATDGDAFEMQTNGNRITIRRTNLNPIVLDLGTSERMNFNTQSGNDSVLIRNTPAGYVVAVNGSLGDDTIRVDSNGDFIGGTVNGLRGQLIIDGGVGNNRLILDDFGDFTADVVHVTPSHIGAAVGDTYFGAGGSVAYSRLQTVVMNMPTALDGDDIFLAPSAATAFVINGSLPAFRSRHGDRLTLDLTGIGNPHLFRLGRGNGVFLFEHAMPVVFTSIERLVF